MSKRKMSHKARKAYEKRLALAGGNKERIAQVYLGIKGSPGGDKAGSWRQGRGERLPAHVRTQD